jgi:hypothetical protein
LSEKEKIFREFFSAYSKINDIHRHKHKTILLSEKLEIDSYLKNLRSIISYMMQDIDVIIEDRKSESENTSNKILEFEGGENIELRNH